MLGNKDQLIGKKTKQLSATAMKQSIATFLKVMLQLLTLLVFEVPPPDDNKSTLNYCVSSFMQMWLGDTLVKYHMLSLAKTTPLTATSCALTTYV